MKSCELRCYLFLDGGGGGNTEKYGSSDDGIDMDDENYIDPQAEDRELKGQLLRRYSGYLGSLKKEFLKKRKKGKLPKEARQQLLDWWNRHLKWPYPSVIYTLIHICWHTSFRHLKCYLLICRNLRSWPLLNRQDSIQNK